MANKYKSVSSMIKALDADAVKDFFNTCSIEKIKEMKTTIEPKTRLSTINTLLYMAVIEKAVYEDKDKNTINKENEQKKIIDILLENGANPNIQDDNGQTLLMYAARSNNLSSFTSLLDNHNVDHTIKHQGLEDVADVAVKSGAVEVFEEILNRGLVDINRTNFMTNETFLHLACKRIKEVDAELMVEFLINKNIDPTVENYEGVLAVEFVPELDDYNEIFEKLENHREKFKKDVDDFDFSIKL